jgi:GDP-L-fucose synthase
MMHWKGKKVLVPGGTGLIGIPLVELLLERGAKVTVVSLDDPSRCPRGAEHIRLDLTAEANCIEVCRGADFIFNMLGTKASPNVTRTKPASHFITNMQLQLPFMEAARKCAVPGMLFASSIGVYGPSEVMHEDDVWVTSPSPNDWFGGWAKRMGELQIEGYRKEYGWNNLTIVRPANVYGPWDCFGAEHSMVVPSLIRKAVEADRTGGELEVWGDGSARRDFIASRDVALGMLQVAEKNPAEPVNLGSGNARSIKELVEIIVGCVNPALKVRWDTTKPAGDRLRCLDTARAEQLGITPSLTLEEGVRETVDWYRKHAASAKASFNPYEGR